ncbi:sugar-binding transcriptional regulator [Lentilactobacillus parakefiri]|uniref:RNA polymerase subunit sigma-70 n=1 Tax=Lentilactobacillus parakefiri TaxID=152332 RepID=A0A269YCS0_9LACO|nr:sugar-binding transcriptional regulator [Lentilactobacillus parakefiri]PAK83344.1 RNA polymerase subunit sigma-70 [Lentilactobacillus parakefiri]
MDEIKDITKLKQSLRVAELYFQDNLSQIEIANQLGVSRPTVSRLLQYAKDNGLVKIQIVNPLVDSQVLSKQLSDKYAIDFHVVPNNYGGTTSVQDGVGHYAADFLSANVQAGDVIGIGWGETIHSITKQLEEQDAAGVQVVQLKGSISHSQEKTWAYESVNELAKAYHTQPEYLPLPVIFDNRVTKEMVESDRHIKHILDLGRRANVALFTVGTVRSEALIFQLGYFNEQEKAEIQRLAVGDIFSRFVDENGKIVSQEIDDRTIGIQLDALKEKPHAILVASGNRKAAAVHAALSAHYTNCAILDQSLAQVLLDY